MEVTLFYDLCSLRGMEGACGSQPAAAASVSLGALQTLAGATAGLNVSSLAGEGQSLEVIQSLCAGSTF